MIKYLALFLSVSSFAATPINLNQICEQTISFDMSGNDIDSVNPPIFSDNFVMYRNSIVNSYQIENLSGDVILKSHESINSMTESGESLWLVTNENIIEIDFTGKEQSRFTYNNTGSLLMRALDIVKINHLIILNRGQAGLFAYDEKTFELVWQNTLTDVKFGRVVAMAKDRELLWLALTNTSADGFSGIVQLNGISGKVIRSTPYDNQRAGIIGIDVKARFHQDKLYLNNEGWIHVMTLNQLQTAKKLRPHWIATVVPKNGEINSHYVMTIGDFLFESGEIVSCGKYMDTVNGQYVFRSKTFRSKY